MERSCRQFNPINNRAETVDVSDLVSWECLVAAIALQIHQALDLSTIFQTSVDAACHLLQCDRVFLYPWNRDGGDRVIVEAVSEAQWALFEQGVDNPCFEPHWLEPSDEQPIQAIADISTTDLPADYADFLVNLDVKATLLVPVLHGAERWGLLVAHHCAAPHPWSAAELAGLQQLVVHLGIAIHQADLVAQLQAAKADRATQGKTRQTKVDSTRKRAKLSRQQSQDERFQLAAIVESSQDAIISKTPDGIIASWNDAAERLFGHTAEEAIGQPVTILIPSELRSKEASILDCIRRGQRVEPYETKRLCKDGRLVDVALTVSPIRDENNVVIGASKIARDISAQRQAQQSLHEQTAILSSFYNSSPLMMGVVELSDDDILHISDNQATATFFNSTVAAMKGQWASDLGAPREHIQHWMTHYRNSQTQQQPVRFEYAHKTDTDTYWLSVSVSFIGIGENQRPRFSYVAEDISDRKQTEFQLRNLSDRLELALKSARIGIWDLDLVNNHLIWDDQLYAIYGIQAADWGNAYEAWITSIHPDDLAHCQTVHEQALAGERDYYCEFRIVWPDGTIRYVESYALLQRAPDGQPLRMTGVNIDVSDRKTAELDLKSTKEQLELVLQASSEGFWDWNWVSNEIYFSPQWKAILGYADDELDNSLAMWESLIFEQDRIAALQLIEDYNSGKVDHFAAIQRFHHKNGSVVYILSRALHLKDAEGKVIRMVGSHLDITENKRQELALQKSETRYRNIIETTLEGVWMLDANHLTSFVNPRMSTLLGYSAETMIGQPLSAFMTAENWQIAQAQLNSRRRGESEQHEFEFQRKDGSSLWVLVSANSILDEAGDYAGAIAMMTDISDRKEIEEKLRKSEAALVEAQRMAHLGSWELDIATKQITWSDELFRMFGFDPNNPEPAYAEHFNHIHPEDRLRLQQSLDRAMNEGIPYELELRILKKDGATGYMEVRGKARFNNQGHIEKLFGTALDITERKVAELALAESQQRFQNLVENSPDIIERFDLQLRHLYVSPIITKITGIAPEAFWGKTCRDLGMDENMIKTWEAAAATLLKTGQKQVIEFETPTLVGVRAFEMAIAPEYSDQGVIESILCLSRDITERKQAELALQESEDRFRVLVTHAPVGIFQTDAQGQCLYVNPRWLEITGLSATAAMGTGWQQALHPDDREAIFAEWMQATQTGRPFGLEYRFQKPDGSITWVAGQAIAVYKESGEIHRYFGTVMDITDRKRTEEELQRQKEMFQAIVDHIPVMIALFNGQGRMDFMNPEFERTLGSTLAEWQQQETLPNFQTDSGNLQDVLAHIRSARGHWSDFTIQTSLQYRLETSWVGVQLSEGRSLGIGQDISDRKRKETALRQVMEAAEAANLAKSMFLANMSHELRTPLNVILGFAQVMAHDPSLTPNQLEDLQTIQRSGDHLLSLINDILDFSKIEAGHYSLEEVGFDLRALLYGLHSMMSERATSKGLELIFDIAPGMPQFILADERKLRQVLLNLLSNAIKFTGQGSVTLRMTWQESQDSGSQSHNPAEAGNYSEYNEHPISTPSYLLQFEVIDTGVGIPPEEQGSIFEAFVQAEAGKKSTSGTGLGLAISRRLIELMNGHISVNSIPNVGSTFTVTVTVRSSSEIVAYSDSCDRPVIGIAAGQPHYRILVVDDQHENRLLMVRLLTRIGLEVQEASNGQEAIQQWQNWQPDLIWMDIRMPGLDGYTATQQIRAMEREKVSIIIALTAQASQGDRTLALAAGCNDYLNKPFREETVFQKMSEYLGLEYLYAEADSALLPLSQGTPPAKQNTGRIFDADIIAQLPPNWLDQLEEATMSGRDKAIIKLTNQLSPELSTLSNYLTELADQFQFEQILQWIDHAYQRKTNDHSN